MNAAVDPIESQPITRRQGRRIRTASIGAMVLIVMAVGCVGSLPYTLGSDQGVPRYALTHVERALMPPFWAPKLEEESRRIAELEQKEGGGGAAKSWFGTDRLGRSVMIRCA